MEQLTELVERLRALSTRIATLKIAAAQCAHELETLLELAICLDQHSWSANHSLETLSVGRFVVDRDSFSVFDGNCVCELGNTICFRFIEFLARKPNCFFTRSQLLAGVWDGQRRTSTTVRSAVFELRSQLRNAGMNDLADTVRNNGRAYGLMVDDLLRTPNGKPTGGPAHFQRRKGGKRRNLTS